MLNGELSEDGIRDLGEICKSAHGLAEQQESDPLAKVHIPEKRAGLAQVKLVSIFHHRGVNALAEDQTLKFSPNLTVVYGDNAAGKTGYIRILKSACRARRPEEILGNVVSGTAPYKPVIAITYKVGTEEKAREWSGDGGDEFISRVSVFDTQCATVYLTEKTDVAFRPFGLDLFWTFSISSSRHARRCDQSWRSNSALSLRVRWRLCKRRWRKEPPLRKCWPG